MAVDFGLEAERRARAHARGLRAIADAIALGGSYRRVFDGHGTPEDADRVLTDLCKVAGFGKAAPLASAEALREREARRAVVLHIFSRIDPLRQAQLADTLKKERQDERRE